MGYHRAIRSPAFVLFFIAMMGAATLYAGFMTFATAFCSPAGMSATQLRHQYQLPFIFRRADLHGLRGDPGEIRLQGSHDADFRRIYRRHGCWCACSPPIQFLGSRVVGVLFVAFVRPVNSVPSLVLPELFGRKDYNRINSLGMAGYYLGATISSFLVAWISEISGSYTNSYMCLAVIALISFVLFL